MAASPPLVGSPSLEVPVRVQLPPVTLRQITRRAMQIGRITARHFGRLAGRRLRRAPVSQRDGLRALRLSFQDLGGSFAKFGQLIGSAPGVFGLSAAEEFRSCLDTGPSVPFETVRDTVEFTLKSPLGQTFASFEEAPIGRASIAVVHRATLHDGRAVAVKILRPGIAAIMAVDLQLMQPMLALLARFGLVIAGQLLRMVASFREQVCEELDLRNEVQALVHFGAVLGSIDLPRIVIPAAFPQLSGPGILTMEFLDGAPIDDLEHLGELGIDPRPTVEQMVKGWFFTTLRDGTFHGDVHAGNLLLLRDGRVAVIDWGIVGRLDPATHNFYRRLVEACLGDDTGWADVASHVARFYGPAALQGLGLSGDQLTAFVRTLLEPILLAPLGEISLYTLVSAVQGQVDTLQHDRGSGRWRRLRARLREQRQFHARLVAHGGLGGRLDRNMFLLGKQVMYFERYGKMFIPDLPLLADRGFYERLMHMPCPRLLDDPRPPTVHS